MSDLTWTPVRVRLGQIKPWTHNPRMIEGVIIGVNKRYPRDTGMPGGVTETYKGGFDMSIVAEKRCGRCGEVKPVSEYYSKGKTPAGTPRLREYCKPCCAAISKKRYADNPQKYIDASKAWNKSHKEQKNRNNNTSRMRNLDVVREKDRQYRSDNREKVLDGLRRYYIANKEKFAQYKRDWLSRNKDKKTVQVHRRRARKMQVANSLSVSDWNEILESYGNKCVYCNSPATEQDHLIPFFSGGGNVPENVVPSCKTCNVTKGKKSLLNFLYYMLYNKKYD